MNVSLFFFFRFGDDSFLFCSYACLSISNKTLLWKWQSKVSGQVISCVIFILRLLVHDQVFCVNNFYH